MKILTIIVSYNFIPWADLCLGSLERSETPCDIMVIDNCSTDGTVAYVKQTFPLVKLVENGENLGFGRANNIGMSYALKNNYDAVLLLNQDAWILPDTLRRLAEVSQHHLDYGIVSPVHLTRDGNKLEKGFSAYTGIGDLEHLSETEIVEVPFINAAIWFIRTDVLRRTGLFAPIFYHYGEDKDLANRMMFHHYKIGYLPSVFACHDRENRRMTKTHFFRSEYVYYLSEYANVNYSFGKAFGLGVLAISKKIFISITKGKWNDAGAFIGIFFRLLMKTQEVAKTRKMSKSVDLKKYKI